MKTKAKLACIAAGLSVASLLCGQSSSNPTLPTVPRGDGTGPAVPSMNPAVGPATGSANVRAAAAKPARTVPGNGPATTDRSKEAARARVGTIDENPANGPTAQVDTGAAVMNTSALSHEIRVLRYNARQELLGQIDARLAENQREIDDLRQSAPRLTGEARTTFRQAMQELKAKREALRHALKTARDATAENWEAARQALATDYEAYSIALTRVEVVTPAIPR